MLKNKENYNPIPSLEGKVALITGGAKRIGACITETLHQAGMTVAIHYKSSSSDAEQLQQKLLKIRPSSALTIKSDLSHSSDLKTLVSNVISQTGRLDTLINNASAFYSTPLESAEEKQWEQLFNTNLKAPFFLTQAAAPFLKRAHGNIVNIVDIYADTPLIDHPIYCATKAGLASLTKSFAQSLGPDIRVNGVAPGAILWPQNGEPTSNDKTSQAKIISATPLQKTGTPRDISQTVLFLIRDAPYITGQIINVDGGRTAA